MDSKTQKNIKLNRCFGATTFRRMTGSRMTGHRSTFVRMTYTKTAFRKMVSNRITIARMTQQNGILQDDKSQNIYSWRTIQNNYNQNVTTKWHSKMTQQNGIQQNNRRYNSLNQNDTSEQLSPEWHNKTAFNKMTNHRTTITRGHRRTTIIIMTQKNNIQSQTA